MIQAKSDYASKKGAEHVAAQCKAFILEKIMVKNWIYDLKRVLI